MSGKTLPTLHFIAIAQVGKIRPMLNRKDCYRSHLTTSRNLYLTRQMIFKQLTRPNVNVNVKLNVNI